MKENLEAREKISESNYRFTLVTGYSAVHIYSAYDVMLEPNDFIGSSYLYEARLPGGLQIFDKQEAPSNLLSISLRIANERSAFLEMNDTNDFHLFGPFYQNNFYMRLPYIAYNVAEKARQQVLNMSSLHAAAVTTQDGKSMLILGDKGSGKTLLSLVLCMEQQTGLIGNDVVLIQQNNGKLFIRSGSQLFDVRHAVVKYYLPELMNHSDGSLHNPYEDKYIFHPDQLQISIGQDTQGIERIVRINIHPFNETTMIELGARRIQEILRLRENLSRYIRGVVTPLLLDNGNFGGFFPSMDNKVLSDQRDEMIEAMLHSRFIYAYGNNPKEIAMRLLYD